MTIKIDISQIPVKPDSIAKDLPVATRVQLLPLARLEWTALERLCVCLVKKDSNTEHAQCYGIRGQSQDGIDLYVRKRANGRYTVWQCKKCQEFGKADVLKAIRKFLKAFRTGQAGIPIQDADCLILAVTADLSDKNIANEIERQNKRLRRINLLVIPLDIHGLSDKLKPHPDIVADFFHPSWVEEFCGIKGSSGTASGLENVAYHTSMRVAQEGLSSYGNIDLDRIRDLWGERREEEALSELVKFKSAATWPMLHTEVQAKALRIEAGLRLQKGDITAARILFSESKEIAPAANTKVLEARLIYHDSGAESALRVLSQPQTDDEMVFRWNLLLELGRSAEVTIEFANLQRKEIPAGDFASVLALAQLAQGNVLAADQTIQTALQKKQNHVTSRYVAAVIDYYWGISIAFPSWQHMTWPLPPHWNLVKRDKISFERRERASQVFGELSRGALKSDVDGLRIWQFACIALNAENETKPSELLHEFLAENPVNIPLLVWASALGFKFDRTNSIAPLMQRMENGSGSVEDFLALLELLDENNDIGITENLLTRHRHLLIKANRGHLWFLHEAQLLIRQSKTTEAIQLISTMPESREKHDATLVTLQLVAEQTRLKRDYEILSQALEEDFKREKCYQSLLECCRIHRLLQKWDFIAQKAEQLVDSIRTQSALELAAEALLNTRQIQQCLDLIQKHREICLNGDLTPYLRQLAAECHRLLGNLPAAISELQQAASTERGVNARMQLFQTQVHKGDLPASLQTARLLSKSPNVPPEFLINYVIPVARHQDKEFAKELALKLVSSPLKLAPETELKLLNETYRLGIDEKASELLRKLAGQSIEGTGPLKALTFDEAKEMFLNQSKAAGELWAVYRRGDIPIHIVSASLNLPLSRLFHETPRLGLQNYQPLQSTVLFTRYAGDVNWQPSLLPNDSTEIFLDITSLLLLDALGLLPKVEITFNRLYIGASLVLCLQQHLDQLSPLQPPRSIARASVVKLLDRAQLRISQPTNIPVSNEFSYDSLLADMGMDWCQRLLDIQSKSGLFVAFLPLHNRTDVTRNVTIPDTFARTLVTVQELKIAMLQAGWISTLSEEIDTTFVPCELHEGISIHLDNGQAEELALANVLDTLCEKGQVTIEPSEVIQLRQEVANETSNSALKTEVHRLLNHLSSGIEKGKYRIHVGKPFNPQGRERPLQPEERALFEAFTFAEEHCLPVCIDDRMVRRHSTIANAQLCDSYDILHHLFERQAISDDVFYNIRAKMRMSNMRYLPLSVEEVVASVKRAPIKAGKIHETPDLRCLRRYFAATLLDSGTLQNPVQDTLGNLQSREGIWPLKLQVTISKALLEIWQQGSTADQHMESRADWIWHHFWFDRRLPAELFKYKPHDYSALDGIAQPIASLFAFGIGLCEPSPQNGAKSLRQRYFEWLADRAVTPLVMNNPKIWERIGHFLKEVLFSVIGDTLKVRRNASSDDDETKAVRYMVGSYVTDLPNELVNALRFENGELEELGLKTIVSSIEILGLEVQTTTFCETIGRALRQNHATLFVASQKTTLRFRYNQKANRLLVSARGLVNRDWIKLNITFLHVLSDTSKQREKALRAEATEFDVDEPRLTEIICEISNTSTGEERIKTYKNYLKESAKSFYRELKQSIADKKKVMIADLLPQPVTSLSRYLRLEAGDTTAEKLASRLIKTLGWGVAMVRLSSLPIRIPASLIMEWQSLTTKEQESRLHKLESDLVSPIERIRLLELLCHSSTTIPDKFQRAKRHLDWLCDAKVGLAQGRAMMSAARWAHLRIGWHVDMQQRSPFERLCVVWSHGCKLHKAFQTAGAAPEGMERWIAGNSKEFFADQFFLGDRVYCDAANPIHLRFSTILLKGVAAACGSLEASQIKDLGVEQALALVADNDALEDLLDMWIDRSLGENILGSYLADLPNDELRQVVGEAVYNQRFRISPKEVVKTVLNNLQEDPHDAESAIVLNLIIRERPLPAEYAGKIHIVLAAMDFIKSYKTSPTACQNHLILCAQLALGLDANEILDELWQKCLRLAKHLAANSVPGQDEAVQTEQFSFLLANVAVRLSATNLSREQRFSRFIEKIIKLSEYWPGFAKVCALELHQILNRAPVEMLTNQPLFLTVQRSRA